MICHEELVVFNGQVIGLLVEWQPPAEGAVQSMGPGALTTEAPNKPTQNPEESR
jgi:hypothetical protein